MTIDERIERLTQRHEALTESVEMLRDRTSEIMAATDRNSQAIGQLTASIQKLADVTNRDADDIRTLARIADAHERRITNLEGEQE